MLRVLYVCVAEQHDLRLVALAAFVCLFACFTATNLYARAEETHRARRLLWVSAAAVVFGCGVWATHFVAELAYRPGLPIVYDESLTALSAAIAVVVAGTGIAVATQRGAVKLGGAIVGAAVGAMHYAGVAAMHAPAIYHWSGLYVAASLAIGMALSATAFAVQSHGAGLGRRIGATGLLVLAIVGLHFTAMAALTLEFDPSVQIPPEAAAPELLAVAVAGVTAVIITIGLASAVADGQLVRQATLQTARLTELVDERTSALHRAQAELLRNEWLSTMGQLTATVAHELRNPLSAARNSLFVIRKTLSTQGIELERPIARVERSVARCERIISDLLDYTRGREPRRAPLPLEAWLEDSLREQRLPEGIVLVRDFRAPDALVSLRCRADAARAGQRHRERGSGDRRDRRRGPDRGKHTDCQGRIRARHRRHRPRRRSRNPAAGVRAALQHQELRHRAWAPGGEADRRAARRRRPLRKHARARRANRHAPAARQLPSHRRLSR